MSATCVRPRNEGQANFKPPTPTRKVRGLRRISAEKEGWRKLYSELLRFEIARNPLCRICRDYAANHGHHPAGQVGPLILYFHPVCNQCHAWVHGHPDAARRQGWLK